MVQKFRKHVLMYVFINKFFLMGYYYLGYFGMNNFKY